MTSLKNNETFPIWVEYWPKGSNHNHILLLREKFAPAYAESLATMQGEAEHCASELAEAIAICSDSRHKGHGQVHPESEVMEAFRIAVLQLHACDFEQVWKDMQQQKRRYARWNAGLAPKDRKPVPEAILIPDADNPNEWKSILIDKEGSASMYDVHKGALEDLMPDPRDMGAKPNPDGPGWQLPPTSPSEEFPFNRN